MFDFPRILFKRLGRCTSSVGSDNSGVIEEGANIMIVSIGFEVIDLEVVDLFDFRNSVDVLLGEVLKRIVKLELLELRFEGLCHEKMIFL